jgi:tetratricopeptide (TPR) repeat protein
VTVSGEKGAGLVQRQARKLEQLQRIVAELKYFLTESPSHQIFIAGKDVDDSWAEDQNKGEGIFESIFSCNIYVPSIFSVKLSPCAGGAGAAVGNDKRRELYVQLARQIGITENSWAFNTAMLILPYLAEYEVYQLMHGVKGMNDVKVALRDAAVRTHLSQSHRVIEFCDHPMSERSCRRLRIVIEYLTYKGRGIPRKILREFYTMVQPSSIVSDEDPGAKKLGPLGKPEQRVVKYVMALPQHHLQKMNFYAGIVEYLDQSFGELRGLTDKGRVSIYHIIDYVLKFYATGFSQRDVEHANFMTTREEYFPSRQLASLIINILDGRLWRRKDSRSPEYRMLHNVVHDLSMMFLRYPPEQMELRHTHADFRDELERLQRSLEEVGRAGPEQRIEPVHTQLRIARILEMTGNHFDARLAYYKALRWMRIDISRYETMAINNSEKPVTGGALETVTERFVGPFLGYAMEALMAVGRLHEEVGELRSAIRLYNDAQNLHEQHGAWRASLRKRKGYQPAEDAEMPEQSSTAREIGLSLFSEEQLGENQHELLRQLWSVLKKVEVMEPLDVEVGPAALVDALNHAGVAYAKLWERASANHCYFKALRQMNASGDEYGVVDQLFFIGQLMFRRRDFRAAALWYLEALKKVRDIAECASRPSSQSGASWETPTMTAGTHAQILASFGDVMFATSGLAILSEKEVKDAGAGKTAAQALWPLLKGEINKQLQSTIQKLGEPVLEDRLDEYFFTWARYRYQAMGDQINATDVYMRQLELRADMFKRALREIDRSANQMPADAVCALKYDLLNSWVSFWRGARVLLHRQLNTPTALTRDRERQWGRVTDFRRMGVLLRLVGDVLRELALHPEKGNGRRLLATQSIYNHGIVGETGTPLDKFYEKFVGEVDFKQPSSDQTPRWETQCLTVHELANELSVRMKLWASPNPELAQSTVWEKAIKVADRVLAGFDGRDRCAWLKWQSAWFVERPGQVYATVDEVAERRLLLARVGVNNASEDIRTVFEYVMDTPMDRADKLAKFDSIGERSVLYNVNGDGKKKTPLAALVDFVPQPAQRGFRSLALAEQAMLASYLSFRDCVTDYSYASTNIALAQIYIVGMVKLGGVAAKNRGKSHAPTFEKQLHEWVDGLVDLAKRHLVKAIDILKREREQNRNTFHLMADAHFNLGDVLLIRLASQLTPGERRQVGHQFRSQLFPREADRSKPDEADALLNNKHGYDSNEDLQRQIWEAYRSGLVWTLSDMEEYMGRYRSPSDIFYAHRNIMDPVLHFRIARASRLRSAFVDKAHRSGDMEFDKKRFNRIWEDLSVRVAAYETPQRQPTRWLTSLEDLVSDVNRVRTDRPPLEIYREQTPIKGAQAIILRWTNAAHLDGLTPLHFFGAGCKG